MRQPWTLFSSPPHPRTPPERPSSSRIRNSQHRKPGQRLGWVRLWLWLGLACCLSGCVRYDLGLRFTSQTEGAIVQRITLSDDVQALTPVLGDQWFARLAHQVNPLDGWGQRLDAGSYQLTVPFYGSTDLVRKFKQVLQPSPNSPATVDRSASPLTPSPNPRTQPPWHGDLPALGGDIALSQDNRLVAFRNHLHLSLDLQALGSRRTQGQGVGATAGILQVAFVLDTPWGVDWARATAGVPQQHRGRRVVWLLPTGAVTDVEAVFWVPSPLGIGAIGVFLLVVGGMAVRRWLPPPGSPSP